MVITEKEAESPSFDAIEDRLCSICSQPIPTARLKVMPSATECVYCLELNGDVDLIKRNDDRVGMLFGEDVETAETYYKGKNQYFDTNWDRIKANANYGSNFNEDA